MRFITLLNKRFSGGFEREPGFPSKKVTLSFGFYICILYNMGLKSVKRMLLKPHHIAFSGLTILILIGVAWYFYSSRRMEGFDARGTYTNKPKPP